MSLKTRALVMGGSILVVSAIIFALLYQGEGTGKLPGFKWRKPLVIDTSLVVCGADMANFPLYVQLQDSDLKGRNQGGFVEHVGGNDIRFTRADGATLLSHRLVAYDPSTGSLAAWVNIDTLRCGAPTFVYLYFGNGAASLERELLVAPATDLRGHFLDGGGMSEVITNPNYPQDWLLTEANNQSLSDSFLVAGALEEMDTTQAVQFGRLGGKVVAERVILLEWATEREQDNDYFVVEHSLDPKSFTQIGKTGGGEDSDYLLRYNLNHAKPARGLNYYRLKQVDNDGDFSYSPTFTLVFGQLAEEIQVLSLNPEATFTDWFEVTFFSPINEPLEVQLFDEQGMLLHQETFYAQQGENAFRYPQATDLKEGVYVLTLMGGDRKLKVVRLSKEEEATS